MEIYVFDGNLNRVDVIDDFKSCIWNMKYYGSGEFELYMPASAKALDVLKLNRFLARDKDISENKTQNVMVIENIKIQTNAETGDDLIISGKCLKSILGRRIIWGLVVLDGKLEVNLRALITSNVIQPLDSIRRIPNVKLGANKGFNENQTAQVTGANLLEFITKSIIDHKIGLDAYVGSDKKITFEFTKAKDRSESQDILPRVIFSESLDNLIQSNYEKNLIESANAYLVAGEGEGYARRMTEAFGVGGLHRREIFVDARDISSNSGQISSQEYVDMLNARGMNALNDKRAISIFDGEINPSATYEFGKDYFLGDIVTVKNKYGISTNAQITGVIESFSESGEQIIPTFSYFEQEV